MKSILLFCLIITLTACGGGESDSAPNIPDQQAVNFTPQSNQWAIAQAQDLGFDVAQLQAAYNQAASQPFVRDLLVVKDGHLVAEAYFNGQNANNLQHLRSITKTVTTMLIGIAIEQGVLSGIEQTLGEFLLEDYPALSNEKAAISIQHLLTMTSGFDWDESGTAEFEAWVNATDPVEHLLQRPLAYTPGTRFNYNSAAVHLLSVILSKAFNDDQQAIANFAQQHFFAPLGINELTWDRLADGRVNGSAGLQLKPEDSAKIGLLLLNDGLYQDKSGNSHQIVPSHWVIAAKTPTFAFQQSWGDFDGTGYGLLWWLGEGAGAPMQLAWGWAGQMIATFPDKNLVVVVNNDHQANATQAQDRDNNSFSLIIGGVLAALAGQ